MMSNRVQVLLMFFASFLILAFTMPVSAVVINDFEGVAGNAIDWATGLTIEGNTNYSYSTTVGITSGTQSVQRSNITGYSNTLAFRLNAAQRTEFMADGLFMIDVTAPADTVANGGWIEVNQVTLNIDGYGWVGQLTSPMTFFYNNSGSPSGVQRKTVIVDYNAQKASMPANPSYIEIVFATNSDGVHTSLYFDNAQLRPASSTVYAKEVLADNPMGWIRFEDSNSKNGSSFPFSQQGHTQTYKYVWGPSGNGNGVITLVPSYAELGTAVEFSGSQNCVSSGVVGTVFDPNMTVELWMNTTNPTDWARLLQQNQGDGTSNCYGIGIGADGSLFVMGGGTDWYGASGMSLKDGKWHHVVVTYQQIGADLKKQCYIDSVLKGSTTHVGKSLIRTQNVLTIGSEGSEWWQWNTYHGALDEIAFYHGALSAERIKAHYNAAVIPSPKNCAEVLALGWGMTSDINKDCKVNMADFAKIASTWMLCNNPAYFNTDPSCLASW